MRLLMVLGMHRSGTSCLTGLLGESGVWLGPVEKGSPHNVKGNNENRRVMNVNKALLAACDASWHEPPPADAPWPAEQVEIAEAVLDDVLAEGRTTAMKDPRSLYTGRGWWELAERRGAEVVAIGTFRRPEPVAASLHARDPDFPIDKALDLWQRYNRRLLEFHDRLDFPIVDFDLDPDAYLAAVRRAFTALDLTPPARFEFFEKELRHQHGDLARPDLAEIHAELRRRAIS